MADRFPPTPLGLILNTIGPGQPPDPNRRTWRQRIKRWMRRIHNGGSS